MMYRINKNFYNKYQVSGRSDEGLFLCLDYKLNKRDGNECLIRVRDGSAQDIDGIVSILLEYGALEEVDCEKEDDSEEEDDLATAMRMIIGSSGQKACGILVPNPKESQSQPISSEYLEEEFTIPYMSKEDSDKLLNLLKKSRAFWASNKLIFVPKESPLPPESFEYSSEKVLLNTQPASKYLDRVTLEINGYQKLYLFDAPHPDKRTEENLLSKCLEYVRECNKKVTEESDNHKSFLKEICEKLEEIIGPNKK